MAGNPGITLMQMEAALNNMQNTMVTEEGQYNLDETFFELFDEIIEKLQDTRAIAQTLREQEQQKISN